MGFPPAPRGLFFSLFWSISLPLSRRFCPYGKKILGRKRHLLVDTQGLLMSVKVLEASLGDREGGRELLLALVGTLPRLQVIWVDSGYAGEPFSNGSRNTLGFVSRSSIIRGPA